MTVLGPQVTCHKCGAKLNLEGDGKLPLHNIKGNKKIVCIGSREKPK